MVLKLGTSESTSETSGQLLNVVLEKDGDQLDRSCERGESVTYCQAQKE